MASCSDIEIEPDFVQLSKLGTFNSEHKVVIDENLIEATLDSVASLVNLGDTNIAVPGRIKGKMEANFRTNIASALAKSDFLYEELMHLESLGVLSVLILDHTL